ncbi:MAG: hypothetical protein Q8S13_02710 [Dehalococcoidia bacterium]|nr:hypothetical protein [Dehalococcoidia bacterium]
MIPAPLPDTLRELLAKLNEHRDQVVALALPLRSGKHEKAAQAMMQGVVLCDLLTPLLQALLYHLGENEYGAVVAAPQYAPANGANGHGAPDYSAMLAQRQAAVQAQLHAARARVAQAGPLGVPSIPRIDPNRPITVSAAVAAGAAPAPPSREALERAEKLWQIPVVAIEEWVREGGVLEDPPPGYVPPKPEDLLPPGGYAVAARPAPGLPDLIVPAPSPAPDFAPPAMGAPIAGGR